MANEFIPAVGVCAMKGNMLVYIDDVSKSGSFSIKYIPHGGGSFWWSAEDFSPITDPLRLAQSKAYMAKREQKEYQHKAAQKEIEAIKWDGVVEVIKELEQMKQKQLDDNPAVERRGLEGVT